MKSIITNITTLIVMVITFASADFVNANTSTADTLTQSEKEAKFEQIEQALLFGLDSDINGVLEATFFNAIAFKTLYPEFESKAVTQKITNVAVEKGNHVVRYKALLTLTYLKDQEQYLEDGKLIELVKSNNAIATFEFLEEKIREQQLASQIL